jgi:hypothetical protein
VKKVQTHSILTDRRPLKRKCVVTMKKLYNIGHQLENSPQKSLQQWTHQSDVSVGSVWTATNCCIFTFIKLLLFPELNLWIMEKG